MLFEFFQKNMPPKSSVNRYIRSLPVVYHFGLALAGKLWTDALLSFWTLFMQTNFGNQEIASVPAAVCLCKPFSCKACPGIQRKTEARTCQIKCKPNAGTKQSSWRPVFFTVFKRFIKGQNRFRFYGYRQVVGWYFSCRRKIFVWKACIWHTFNLSNPKRRHATGGLECFRKNIQPKSSVNRYVRSFPVVCHLYLSLAT